MPEPTKPSTAKRILVVEDDREILSIIQHIGSMAGLNIDCVPSGVSALEKFSSEGADVVLLDLMLDDLNGLEIAERIRSLPHGGSTKLVLISGVISNETRGKAKTLAFAKILQKPVAVRALIQILKDLTANSP